MKNLIPEKIKKAPFVFIDNKEVNEKLKNKPLIRVLVDILDGDLWSSKVSFFDVSSIIAPNSNSWQFSGSSPVVSMSMLI